MSTSVPPALPPGNYVITSVSANLVVSRPHVEDASLFPKRIVVLAAGAPYAVWKVTKNADGTYKLTNRNDPAVEINDKLFAELTPTNPPREKRWTITAVPNHGPDQYIIESADLRDGWLLPAGTVAPMTQVEVKPLIVYLSLPPQYPANERFIFKRVV